MSNNHLIEKNVLKSLFFTLIANQKWDMLLDLIKENQIDLNYRDDRGRNALFWAMNSSNIELIEKLIKLNINKNVTTNLSAINYAVYKDDVKMIKCLKKCGICINETDEINSTPLIYAVLYNKLNSINYLVENGADIFHEDFLGNSAYSLAHDLKIQYLINKFNNTN